MNQITNGVTTTVRIASLIAALGFLFTVAVLAA